jgi:hypothetical protein
MTDILRPDVSLLSFLNKITSRSMIVFKNNQAKYSIKCEVGFDKQINGVLFLTYYDKGQKSG